MEDNQVYKLYSDGNHFPVVKSAGYGGYVVDPKGQILVEFTQQIKEEKHICNFELLGIIRALELAKDVGAQNVISHCDHKISVKFLNLLLNKNIPQTDERFLRHKREFEHDVRGELYSKIQELSHHFKSIEVKYIPRDFNKRSDALSRKYVGKLESNYMKEIDQIEKDSLMLLNSNATPIKSKNEYIFTYNNYIKINKKNNPFMSSILRNKKIRRFCMNLKDEIQGFLFINYSEHNDSSVLSAYMYNQFQQKIKIPIRYEWALEEKLSVKKKKMFNKYQQYLREVLTYLHNKKVDNLWVYSNIGKPQDIMEQKSTFKYFHLPELRETIKEINKFNKVLFNRLPIEFLPEDNKTKKKKIEYNNNYIDELVDRIKIEKNELNRNKMFGKLVSIYVRKIKSDLKIDELSLEEVNSIKTDLEQLCYKITEHKFKK